MLYSLKLLNTGMKIIVSLHLLEYSKVNQIFIDANSIEFHTTKAYIFIRHNTNNVAHFNLIYSYMIIRNSSIPSPQCCDVSNNYGRLTASRSKHFHQRLRCIFSIALQFTVLKYISRPCFTRLTLTYL